MHTHLISRIKPLMATLLVLCTLVGGGTLSSCKDKKQIKSLSQMLKEEKQAIQNFIQTNQLNVKEYVEGQTSFEPNVYYHFPNGLYLSVIEPGGEKAEPEKTHVLVRFAGTFFDKDKEHITFDNISNPGYQDTEFLYVDRYVRGVVHFILVPNEEDVTLNAYMCEGLAFPLSLLGNGARVRLLIPFSLGPERTYQRGLTMHCTDVRYEFVH